jgi:hypothetical protein
MNNVVRSSFQAASQELIARLIKAGYLQPALRNDADAITTAIARLKEDLRGERDDDGHIHRARHPTGVAPEGKPLDSHSIPDRSDFSRLASQE